MAARSDVTRILHAMGAGDFADVDRLIELVYGELNRMARGLLRGEGSGRTLQPTVLVHEAYLRLVGAAGGFENRAHFFGAAAEAMRRVIVDQAREKAALKRGGGQERVTLQDLQEAAVEPDLDILALNEAVDALEAEEHRLAQVVKLRYFVGLSLEETAEALEISLATVKRDWSYARAWIHERMTN